MRYWVAKQLYSTLTSSNVQIMNYPTKYVQQQFTTDIPFVKIYTMTSVFAPDFLK